MSFRITVEPSGHTFDVEPGESVLDAALRCGLVLPYGCRDGACGSCAGKVRAGNFEYPGDSSPSALEGIDQFAGEALFCKAVPTSDMTIEVREIAEAGEIQPRRFPCRVARIEHLADDVVQLFLKLPKEERLLFLAGQYIDFLLKDGRRRAFSIANAPHDDEFIELQIRHVDGGEFTGYVFEQMKEKAIMRIEGPFGGFYLREESDRPIILMGGGTGFAPLNGIIEHAFHVGIERPMHLFWGARARPDLYLNELPQGWAGEHDSFRYTAVLSEPAEGEDWEGETGWVHESVVHAYPDMSGFDVYMSGPPVMIQSAREAFLKAGLPEQRLFYDSFDYASDSQSDD